MTKILTLKSGSQCGDELSLEYKNEWRQKFKNFKENNQDFFSNENLNIDDLAEKITRCEPFSFCRFSDGEYLLMQPKYRFVSLDGVLIPGKPTKLGDELKKIISYRDVDFKLGLVLLHLENLPNMFFDIYEMLGDYSGYEEILWPTTAIRPRNKWCEVLNETKKDVVLVANENIDVNNLCVDINEFFPIPTQGIDYYENNSEKFKTEIQNIAVNNSNSIFIISAGMLANVVCYEGWKLNKSNWYIDIGAGIHNLKIEEEIK
jgi:hypothetical protein